MEELSSEELCRATLAVLDTIPRRWTYLSSLGIALRKQDVTWTGKLRSILEECEAISLLPDPTIKERIFICRTENKGLCESHLGNPDARKALEFLPRALLLAFCVPLPNPTDKVYLSLTDRVHYSIAEAPANDGYVLVEGKYRKPGLAIYKLNEVVEEDAQSLYKAIQDWASLHAINLEDLTVGKGKPSQVKPALQSSNALSRLLAAIPSDVRAQINIPADIAELLLRHL